MNAFLTVTARLIMYARNLPAVKTSVFGIAGMNANIMAIAQAGRFALTTPAPRAVRTIHVMETEIVRAVTCAATAGVCTQPAPFDLVTILTASSKGLNAGKTSSKRAYGYR